MLNFEFEVWIPILISCVSLIWTVCTNIKSNKRLEKTERVNEDYKNWKKEFDIEKEENIRKYNEISRCLADRSTRTSIIPYFNIVLNDDRILKKKNNLIIEVGFINVGKESATNIQLIPIYPYKKLKGYFKSESFPIKQYYIYEYLNKYYAMQKEEVTFKIKVSLENDEKINDFILFKIKYSDLINNEYEQEFEFGIYTLDNIGFSMNNISYKPVLKE